MIGKDRGSLLVTAAGFETETIPENIRDVAVRKFYLMKLEAERHHDSFYALSEVYCHQYTYGAFYPHFVNMSWTDFQACNSLKGISQLTFEMMQGFCQMPNMKTLEDETVFQEMVQPHAHTGYSNPQAFSDYIGDLSDWEEWHRKWYMDNPSMIDWSMAKNNLFPRPDIITKILIRELLKKYLEDHTVEEAMHIVDQIPENEVAHEFHDKVMRHKGGAMEAYSSEIGSKICICNYYKYESELSSLEQQSAAGSFRKIFSIVNPDGCQRFISIDFRHGMFEFHDEHGNHLGEYRFDGSYNSEAEEDHSLRCLDQWLRQTR